jgi:hypothetical protein
MRSAGAQMHREPGQRYALIKAKLRVPAAAGPAILSFRPLSHRSWGIFIVPAAEKRDHRTGRYRNLENVG